MKTILILKPRTSKARAETIRKFVSSYYPAKLNGRRGSYEISFKTRKQDTKPIWFMLLIKDVRDIKDSAKDTS